MTLLEIIVAIGVIVALVRLVLRRRRRAEHEVSAKERSAEATDRLARLTRGVGRGTNGFDHRDF